MTLPNQLAQIERSKTDFRPRTSFRGFSLKRHLLRNIQKFGTFWRCMRCQCSFGVSLCRSVVMFVFTHRTRHLGTIVGRLKNEPGTNRGGFLRHQTHPTPSFSNEKILGNPRPTSNAFLYSTKDQSHSPDTDVAVDASTSPCKRLEVERDRFVKLTEFGPVPTFPRILCVSRRYLRKNKYVDITGEYHIDLIQDFGGAPIILPRTTRTIQQLCEHLPMDGLVIAEGNDLSDDILLKYGCNIPERLTGEAAQKFASDTEMDVSKDELEFALMRFALAAGVPILTFCRGSQMLNCMRGGTLIGDIESQTDSTIKHLRDSSEPDYDSFRHPIKVVPKTPLAEWFADSLGKHGDPNVLMVNSYHHQASKDLGWSLVPMAHSPDGIIEAFYDPRYDPKAGQFVVGLQFHPERMLSDYPGCARCYQSFLEACTAYKAIQDSGL